MLTEKQFLSEVANHQLKILKDDGIYRHIRLQEPGTMLQHFDILTWPGTLCYTGDMGTYVFSRTTDMFTFFRIREQDRTYFELDQTLRIKPGYWAEKVEAGDTRHRGNGIKNFSIECAQQQVAEVLAGYAEDIEPLSAELKESIESSLWDIHNATDEWEFITAMRNYEPAKGSPVSFDDFFEKDLNEFEGAYIFACYAIVWAIDQYDKAKVGAASVSAETA